MMTDDLSQADSPESPPRALAGLRVLDLADEKGAYCGKLLAQMGADVIKIEPPHGDITRTIPPFWKDEPHPDHSLFFLYMNTDKRSITLDIGRPEGLDLFRRLASSADIVLETFQPGYLEQLGIGFADLQKLNAGLIMTSVTPFGQTGPYKHYKSCDLTVQALSGLMNMAGYEDDPPVKTGGGQSNTGASSMAAAATMMAVFYRRMAGVGQHIDISMEEAMVSIAHIGGVSRWLEDGIVSKRTGDLMPLAPCGVFQCKDGTVFLMIHRAAHWQSLAKWIYEVTGNEQVLDPMFEGSSPDRLRHRDLLNHYVEEFTSKLTVAEVFHGGQHRHFTVTPMNSIHEITEDAHLAAREYFVQLDHAIVGTQIYPGSPMKLSETPCRFARPAPQLGQHNVEVFCHELGISSSDLARYRELRIL